MSKIIKMYVPFILILCFAVLLAPGNGMAKTVLRTVNTVDPVNLDPAHLFQTPDRNIAQQVYQGLVTYDYAADAPYPIIPVLAESYEVAEDAKSIIFKLHKGVQFHHGYGEFTAEDVVFTLKRHQDPKAVSRAKNQVADVENVEALDKYTVKITLKNPSALSLIRCLAWQTAGCMMSKKATLELGDKLERFPVGTGPFYFADWQPGEKVILKKFDQYWGKPQKIDEIVYWIIKEQTVALGALEKGDLDVVPLSQMGSYDRGKSIKNIDILFSKGATLIYLYTFVQAVKPMDDLRVRRALMHAIDLKELARRVGPQVRYFPSPFAPTAFAATDEFWNYEYDVEKAKKLLAEAGYPNGFKLKMVYTTGSLYEPVALEVKRYWQQVVDVDLRLVERGVWFKTITQPTQHVVAFGLARAVPFLFAEACQTDNSRNYGGYSNPKVDEIIEKARWATSEAESRRLWREFQRLVTEDVSHMWAAMGISIVAVKKNLKGIIPHPTPGIWLMEDAYFE